MRLTHFFHQLIGVVSLCATLTGCGDDSGSTPSQIDALSLTSLSPKQLGSLCAELLPKIVSASTPTRQCTLRGLSATTDEASCKTAQQDCLDGKTYDDWTKAVCASITASDAGATPQFACSTKVSEVKACFDKEATFLAGLACKQAGVTPIAPPCLADLEAGDCKFDIGLLLKDTDFKAPEADEYVCKDPGGEDIPYDLGAGASCNACATAHCCSSLVACVNDSACACFLNCSGSTDACFSKCGITDYPALFNDHFDCLQTDCGTPCQSLFAE